MPRAPLVIGLLALAACKHEAKLVHQALPGFSIDLPEGRSITNLTALEYSTGSYAVRDDDHPMLAILGWNAGTKLAPSELDQMLSVFGAMTNTKGAARIIHEPGPQGTTVETAVFPTDRAPISITQIQCGGRNVVIALGADAAADAYRARVLASFHCTPDPAKELNLGTVELAIHVELPGWNMLSHSDGQLMLTDDSSMVMLQPMASGTADLISAIGPMIKLAFNGAVIADPIEGDHVPLHGTIDGQAVVGFAKLIPCKSNRTIVFEVSPTREASETVRKAFDAARCLAAGEPAPTWPAIASEPSPANSSKPSPPKPAAK